MTAIDYLTLYLGFTLLFIVTLALATVPVLIASVYFTVKKYKERKLR